MIGVIRQLLNPLAAFLVRRKVDVALGYGTRLRWFGLVGQRYGTVRIGDASIINCRFDFDGPGASIVIGDRCFIGASHLVCREGIWIGNDVVVSWAVTIVDHNSHSIHWTHRKNDVVDWAVGKKDWRYVDVRPVIIGDKVWVGFGATILKGVVIGEGAVIGAHAVITKDVPAYSVMVGNPAKPVRQIDDQGSHGYRAP